MNSSNASVTLWNWDGYGNLTQETDPNGNVTAYKPDSNSLYLQKKVQAYGTSMAQTFTYTWDTNVGLLTSKTDVDNGVTSSYGYDALGRTTNITEGTGHLPRETQTSYNDAARQVTVQRDQNSFGDGALTSITTYDQLYRVSLTQQMESPSDSSGIKVETRYMYNGESPHLMGNLCFGVSPRSSAARGIPGRHTSCVR